MITRYIVGKLKEKQWLDEHEVMYLHMIDIDDYDEDFIDDITSLVYKNMMIARKHFDYDGCERYKHFYDYYRLCN